MNEKRYTKDHEWVELKDKIATVGISNFAQESLGDIVFIELPPTGKKVKSNDEISVVESVKAASDIYSPLDGEIIQINEELNNDPSLINKDPESSGWIFKLEISNISQFDNLMSPEDYSKFLNTENS